jgi:hypothetical protein
MILKTLAMASAGLALVATPVAATAASSNPASSLSVAKSVRAGSATTKSNKLAGASTIPVLIGAAIIAGVTYLIVDKENDDDDADSN